MHLNHCQGLLLTSPFVQRFVFKLLNSFQNLENFQLVFLILLLDLDFEAWELTFKEQRQSYAIFLFDISILEQRIYYREESKTHLKKYSIFIILKTLLLQKRLNTGGAIHLSI